jgi:hypothetical protein
MPAMRRLQLDRDIAMQYRTLVCVISSCAKITSMNRISVFGSICAVLVTACATQSTTFPRSAASGPASPSPVPVPTPSLGFFSKIKAPSTHEPALQLASRGVQIFRCEKRDAGTVWVFRQPQADLLDSSGNAVGQHGANFSFEHEDGSRLVSNIAAYDEASKPTDLRWLLLTTRSFGKGALENVTHVQRVNTSGGMPPARCEASQLNQLLRVDFTSDFVFYRPRPE